MTKYKAYLAAVVEVYEFEADSQSDAYVLASQRAHDMEQVGNKIRKVEGMEDVAPLHIYVLGLTDVDE